MVEIGLPILYTITGHGIWEGRIDWLDPIIAYSASDIEVTWMDFDSSNGS